MLALRLLALLTASLLLVACGGDADDEAAPAEEPEAVAPAEEETTEEPEPAAGAAGCRPVRQPEPRGEGTGTAPTALLAANRTYEVVVSTSCGDFTITLDQEASPQTTASFVALAENGFYSGTVFHRIVPGFVIQGGDPTGTGMGGPGYTTVDTPAEDTTYPKGVVAMAKTEQELRGTAGSQFFVVTGPDVHLPPDYAVIGEVTDGMDVVDRIAVLGDPNTQLPTQPVVVDRMVVRILDG